MTTSSSTNPPPQQGVWYIVKPYAVPIAAASIAIVPAYFDFAAKSAIQIGEKPAGMGLKTAIKGGLGLSPVVAALVGTQMCLQWKVEQALVKAAPNFFAGDSMAEKTLLTLGASSIVGGLSSPVVAVFNDKLGVQSLGVRKTLSSMSIKTVCAISLQETGFVAGLAAAGLVSVPMKKIFGDNKGVEYLAAAVSGACGSLVGHPGNTVLTRSQNNMSIENLRQLTLGSFRRARGCAIFSVVYKLIKEAF